MLLATVAALAAPLGACANTPNFGNLFGGTDSASLPDEPAEKLYNEGIALQNRRDWRRAALKFMEIDRTHPYTEWAKRALIMAAYSFYESQDYEETINQSRRFLQLHPGAPDAPMPSISRARRSTTRSPTSSATRPAPSAPSSSSTRSPASGRSRNMPSPPAARSRSPATSSPAVR